MAKKSAWGFDTRDLDTRTRPQDDFFTYASGGWIKRNPIPKEESRWGSFTRLRHMTDRQLQTLVKKIVAKKNARVGSPTQMIGDYVRSGMNIATRNARGLSPLAPYLQLVNRLSRPEEIVPLVGALEAKGFSGIWGTDVDQDMKNCERYVLYLMQGGLGMPDRDYYLKSDPESKRVRTAYKTHLENMFALIGRGKTAAQEAAIVLQLETKLARASMKKEDARDVDKTYHRYSFSALRRHTPRIDWVGYFKALGADPRELIVMQPDFFKAVDQLLFAVPLEYWKIYLRLRLVSDVAAFLTTSLERENFNFYATVLTGTKHMKPLWRRVLGVVNRSLGELLGELYVQEYFGPESKRKVERIVDDLFTAYDARIRALDWMTPVTKRKALQKLHQMNRKLGYPDIWKSYKGLRLLPDDYAGNALRVSAYEHRRALRKLRASKVNRKEWFMSPQTVNAYYSYGMNEIVFPAAILQHPFFDITADDAVNYGAIGSVIGHEITHGFDDQGSKFDGHGNRKTWWTKVDRNRFEQKSRRLINEFNSYEVAPKLAVNGKLTLGENIADLGGLSIAYDALMIRLRVTGRTTIDGFTPEQRFFLGYAATEREQQRSEFTKTQVLTDPHSPSMFRVNGPLSNMPEFYAAFNVKKGDKLFRPPKERAKIW